MQLAYIRRWKSKSLFLCLFMIIQFFSIKLPAEAFDLLESTLKDSFGVRPIGMGGTFTAVANDVNAVFYNPAGLTGLGFQILTGNIDTNHLLTKGWENSAYSFGSLTYGRWWQEDLTGQKVMVESFALGRESENKRNWGVSFKKIYGLSGQSFNGWTIDLGLLMEVSKGIKFGILFQDIFREKIDVGSSLRSGLSLSSPDGLMMAALDVELRDFKKANGPKVLMHCGYENEIADGLVLRLGWDKDRYTFGATVDLLMAIIEYAVTSPSGPTEENIQSVGFRFNSKF